MARKPEEVRTAIQNDIELPSPILSPTGWWKPVRALEALFPSVAEKDRAMRPVHMRYGTGGCHQWLIVHRSARCLRALGALTWAWSARECAACGRWR